MKIKALMVFKKLIFKENRSFFFVFAQYNRSDLMRRLNLPKIHFSVHNDFCVIFYIFQNANRRIKSDLFYWAKRNQKLQVSPKISFLRYFVRFWKRLIFDENQEFEGFSKSLLSKKTEFFVLFLPSITDPT